MRRSIVDGLTALFEQDELWVWGGLAIALGIFLGLLFVLLIVFIRRQQNFNSLMAMEDCIGLSAVVEVPFDEMTSGKVTVQLDNRTLDCVAYASQPHQFQPGDAVVVVGLKGQKVWVIPAKEFHD